MKSRAYRNRSYEIQIYFYSSTYNGTYINKFQIYILNLTPRELSSSAQNCIRQTTSSFSGAWTILINDSFGKVGAGVLIVYSLEELFCYWSW